MSNPNPQQEPQAEPKKLDPKDIKKITDKNITKQSAANSGKEIKK